MSVLQTQSLSWESDIEYSVIIYDGTDAATERPVATGSFSSNIIKCVAVIPSYEGTGLAQRLVTLLIEELSERECDNIFIFTKPSNIRAFSDLGFHEIMSVDQTVTLMEQNPSGISNYCRQLSGRRKEGKDIGAIVVNCNPFTLGHRYVIEKAASVCSHLFVIVLSEDRSEFSAAERLSLVRQGVADLEKVTVLSGGDYVISHATFPTYFIKDEKVVRTSYARLDSLIFARYIAPALSITRRFVGEEPYCPVTRDYNTQLEQILTKEGIEVTIIPRLEHDGKAISASYVRSLFAEGRLDLIADIVPDSTYQFLASSESESARKKIRAKIAEKGKKR